MVFKIDDGKVNVVGYEFLVVINEVFDCVEVEVKVVVLVGWFGRFLVGFDFFVMKEGGVEEVMKLVNVGGKMLLWFFLNFLLIVVVCIGYVFVVGVFMFLVLDMWIGV